MIATVLSALNLAGIIYLGIFLIRDRTESNLIYWEHGMRLDDLEKRVGMLEKRVSKIEKDRGNE